MSYKKVSYLFTLFLVIMACSSGAVFAQEAADAKIEKKVIEVVENGKTYTFEITTEDGVTLVNGKKIADLSEDERKVYERIRTNGSGRSMIVEMIDQDGNRHVTARATGEGDHPVVWTTDKDDEMEVEVDGDVVIVRKKRSGIKDSDEAVVSPEVVVEKSVVVIKSDDEDEETTYEITVEAEDQGEEKEIEVKVIDGEVFINGKPAEEFEGNVNINKSTGNAFFIREDEGDRHATFRVFESDEKAPMVGHRFAFPMGNEEADFEVRMPHRYSAWVHENEDGDFDAEDHVRMFGQVMRAPHSGMRMEELEFGGDGLKTFYSAFGNPPDGFFMYRDMFDSEIASMEKDVQDIVRKLQNAEGQDKTSLEDELDAKLEAIFDKKLALRQEKLEEMMEEIHAERDAIQRRKESKEEIINRRKQELMGKTDPLRW